MTKRTPASLLFNRELRTALPFVITSNSSHDTIKEDVKSYQERVKAYHDQRNNVRPHRFKVGDVVFLVQNAKKNKLDSKFSTTRYVVVEFRGRDTCKVVNTTNGQVYIRNVKYLTLAPTDSKTLFDDVDEENREANKEIIVDSCDRSSESRVDITTDQPPVVRTRSGRISKPNRREDYVYY